MATTNDISCSVRQTDTPWSGGGQPIFDARWTVVFFDAKDFDTINLHNAKTQDSGTALGTQDATAIQDTTKVWEVDQWVGKTIRITSGAAIDEVHKIVSNTVDTIVIADVSGVGWIASISNGDGYEISDGTKIRIPDEGKWLVKARLTYLGNSAGVRGLSLYVNGVCTDSYFCNPVGIVESSVFYVTCFGDFERNDVLEVYGYQTSDASLKLLSTDFRVQFQLIAQRGV